MAFFWPFGLYEGQKAKKRPKKKLVSKCLKLPNSSRKSKKKFRKFLAWGPRSPRSEVAESALFEAADCFYMCRRTFWHTSLVWSWRDLFCPGLGILHCCALDARNRWVDQSTFVTYVSAIQYVVWMFTCVDMW